MHSAVVVLPASTWATIPTFLSFERFAKVKFLRNWEERMDDLFVFAKKGFKGKLPRMGLFRRLVRIGTSFTDQIKFCIISKKNFIINHDIPFRRDIMEIQDFLQKKSKIKVWNSRNTKRKTEIDQEETDRKNVKRCRVELWTFKKRIKSVNESWTPRSTNREFNLRKGCFISKRLWQLQRLRDQGFQTHFAKC